MGNFRTGTEVTKEADGVDPVRRGVVDDGHVRKSGRCKGQVSVIWIGADWSVSEFPEDLKAV